MKHVVGVSLGSSRRDARAELRLLGEDVVIERIGTDGDKRRLVRLLQELDGRVDAIGLGGIDLFLQAGTRRYYMRDALRFARHVRKTPLVDGSGIKNSWEPHVVLDYLPQQIGYGFSGRRVLQVSSVDRYGMAWAFWKAGAQVVYGDFLFALGFPIPLRSLRSVHVLAAVLLPVLTKLPLEWLYPIGPRQDKITPRYGHAFRWAEVIAGDFHLIRRFMPDDLTDKVVLTQTITPQDVAELRRRGVGMLVTMAPELNGRSFATNLLQALVVAFAGKDPDALSPQEYVDWMYRFDFRPRVEWLSEPRAPDLRALHERLRAADRNLAGR
ncbi:MAG: quinate 5-dehydrogenase [Armatimonadota bacterium]|nr:quinate 5-dehydrogenase [Armatimonadota bacterium]MDR5697328.1 quinate 5-dehydrogenase [Armatimonadota bacterium]